MKLLKSGHRTGAFYLLQAKKKEKKWNYGKSVEGSIN